MPRLAFAIVSALGWTLVLGCTRPLELTGTLGITADAGSDARAVGDGGRPNGGRGGAFGGTRDGGTCVSPLPIMPPAPVNVVLLVGRNPSMASVFGATTRIQAVQAAIEQVAINGFSGALSFGYLGYPGLDPTDKSCNVGACCVNSAVDPTPKTGQAISLALQPCGSGVQTQGCLSPIDNRPMIAAFNALSQPDVFPKGQGANIILFADSAPGCGTDSPSQACADVKQRVSSFLQNQQAAPSATASVWVIPIDQDLNCLGQIALVGSGKTTSPVSNEADLAKRLRGVLSGIARDYCTISLTTEPRDRRAVQVLVTDDAGGVTLLPVDDGSNNGWSFAQGSQGSAINVNGAACQSLQMVTIDHVKVQELSSCP